MDLGNLLLTMGAAFALVALAAYFLIDRDHTSGLLPSRAEAMAAAMLLSVALLIGAMSLNRQAAAKAPENAPQAAREDPIHTALSSLIAAGEEKTDSARSKIERAYFEENARPAPTFEDVMNAMSECRSATGELLDELRGGGLTANAAVQMATGASRTCDGDRKIVSDLALAQPAKQLCDKLIWAHQSLDQAAISGFDRLTGNESELAAHERDIQTAQTACDLALRS
ncbi:MAG: hypothetical protein JWR77_1195 [Rhizorhabdus sp.]|nr:hypothetical protein [Rhizorhabdus sp.]